MPVDHLIPAIIGMLIFGVPTGYVVRLLLLALHSRSWNTTPDTTMSATVKHIRVHQESVSVTYRYSTDGTTYSVYFGSFLNANATDARETAARYCSWTTVPVYYHPVRPHDVGNARRVGPRALDHPGHRNDRRYSLRLDHRHLTKLQQLTAPTGAEDVHLGFTDLSGVAKNWLHTYRAAALAIVDW